MNKPIAVLISDIHYDLNTLPLAEAATRQAIRTANELGVTLAVLGDLHNTKANMRGECVNAMIETFKLCERPPVILVGNHDRLNEKAPAHSLNFLAPYAMIIDEPKYLHPIGYMIPYQHNTEDFIIAVKAAPPKAVILCHQGIQGSLSGDYIQDKSAIKSSDVQGRRVISGHYHTRQTIDIPDGGIWNYVGNPYSLNYAEANDPIKGYQILYSDGSLEFVPTYLRVHIVVNLNADLNTCHIPMHTTEDLVWVKITDTKERLMALTKDKIASKLGLMGSFRLDLIPTDTNTQTPEAALNLTEGPLLDSLIDSLSNTSDERKERLKNLWKALE